jgi:hypothetical protein
MHFAGAESWTLNVSAEPGPLAIYIRDALRLDTSGDPMSPPPLTSRPPDASALLTGEERRQAAVDWSVWWRNVLRFDGILHSTSGERDFLTWYRSFAEERAAAVGEAPGFDALARSPALHRACVELFPQARTWMSSEPSESGPSAVVEHGLAAAVAEDVAARRGMSIGSVRGVVLAYGVEGIWWRVAEPGVSACSTACLESKEAVRRVLHDVFESSLAS